VDDNSDGLTETNCHWGEKHVEDPLASEARRRVGALIGWAAQMVLIKGCSFTSSSLLSIVFYHEDGQYQFYWASDETLHVA